MKKFAVVLSLISLVLNVSASTQPSLKVKKLGVSFPQRDPTQSVYEFVSYAGNRGSDMFRIRFEELKDDIFSNFELGLSSDHGRSWADVERWKAAPPGPDGRLRRLFIYGSFFDPKNIPFNSAGTDVYSSKLPINELTKAILFLVSSKFNGVINIGGKSRSDFENYKKFKSNIKPCKRKDIIKDLSFKIARDASMNLNIFKKLKS